MSADREYVEIRAIVEKLATKRFNSSMKLSYAKNGVKCTLEIAQHSRPERSNREEASEYDEMIEAPEKFIADALNISDDAAKQKLTAHAATVAPTLNGAREVFSEVLIILLYGVMAEKGVASETLEPLVAKLRETRQMAHNIIEKHVLEISNDNDREGYDESWEHVKEHGIEKTIVTGIPVDSLEVAKKVLVKEIERQRAIAEEFSVA